MKAYSVILIILLVSFVSCNKDDETLDPIIGNWKLVEKSVDGVIVEFTECLSQNRLEFYSDETVSFNNFFTDIETGNCESQNRIESWENYNGHYRVFNGSLFNQERTLSLESSQLIYSFESWEITDNDIITSDLIFTYEKE
jgi:hypothetical protein